VSDWSIDVLVDCFGGDLGVFGDGFFVGLL